MGVTAHKGHPDELMPPGDEIPDFVLKEMEKMSPQERAAFLEEHENKDVAKITTPSEAVIFVQKQVDNGTDYIKVMIEEGSMLASPGLPMLSDDILRAAINEAHRLGKIVIAHTLTAEATKKAVELGVDGLAHLFIDRPSWVGELVTLLKERNIFIVPTLVLAGSITGNITHEFSRDPRVTNRLSEEWVTTLRSSFHTAPHIIFQNSLDNVYDLHRAGVTILVGTDASVPLPSFGGLAHGASVHHELELLVQAGLTPQEALSAATSKTAEVFSLHDRGTISVGKKADLLLLKGNPLNNISDSLNIISVFKNGNIYR